jgi:Ser/Thr protein kinase RdoA (MazF antagonist)
MMPTHSTARSDFDHLTPDVVIEQTERVAGVRASNICRPLNSYINRVYEVHLSDGRVVIAKFYRPGRWSKDALQDELDFVTELAREEIPVVAPIPGPDGDLLHRCEDAWFAVAPRRGGRICDEPSDDQWRELGRLIARVHLVGAAGEPRDRIRMHPHGSAAGHLREILDEGLAGTGLEIEFREIAERVLERVAPLFDDSDMIRIHGDCHHQNLLHRPGESFTILDFDDMAVGPPVQDVWMLLPGRVEDSRRELDLFLDGYELFRPMPPSALRLVEPLRFMRYLHYAAWCVRQAADGGFARISPDFGTREWWRNEIREMLKQEREIEDSLRPTTW